MSESTVEISDKRLKNETTSEEQISHDMVEVLFFSTLLDSNSYS